MVFYKYWENGRWNLGKMNIFKALICKLYMGDNFHFVPRSRIKYV